MLRLNNPLSFPGRMPGFNSAHPAAKGCAVSAVAIPGQYKFLNLINAVSAGYASNTALIDGVIGPTVYCSLANVAMEFANTGPATVSNVVCASIFRVNSIASLGNFIAGSGGNGIGIGATSGQF